MGTSSVGGALVAGSQGKLTETSAVKVVAMRGFGFYLGYQTISDQGDPAMLWHETKEAQRHWPYASSVLPIAARLSLSGNRFMCPGPAV